jgi:hypothetical protein
MFYLGPGYTYLFCFEMQFGSIQLKIFFLPKFTFTMGRPHSLQIFSVGFALAFWGSG